MGGLGERGVLRRRGRPRGLVPVRPPADDEPDPEEPGRSYLGMLRAGLVEAAAQPAVRRALVAVALLSGVDAVEEYFTLLARDWAVPTALAGSALAQARISDSAE